MIKAAATRLKLVTDSNLVPGPQCHGVHGDTQCRGTGTVTRTGTGTGRDSGRVGGGNGEG